ncbi:hypothetical protein MYX77_03620 [Acidobacteriia bacterium AH_259_A11_L15]|nr:hypothetical protein [Acidobacteriia bacterium AH_259_A11_L15]
MIDLYCDESNDNTTYSLAGWIASPTSWDRIVPHWRQMLEDLNMPEFHAAEIVGRDTISDSRFKGWTFDQEVEAFKRAVNILVEPCYCADLKAVGCSISVPGYLASGIKFADEQDGIWMLLFVKLFYELATKFPPGKGFNLMFDERKEVRDDVNNYAYQAQNIFQKVHPELRKTITIGFGKSQEILPLQTADLFSYEWRKRITDRRERPDKKARVSYTRLRAGRPALLHHYGDETFRELHSVEESAEKKGTGLGFIEAFMLHKGTED